MRFFNKYINQVTVALAVLWTMPVLAQQPATPKSTVEDIVSTIALEKKSLEKGVAWEREESRLEDDYRSNMLELAWLEKNEELLSRYVEEANERLAEMTRTKARIEQIEGELVSKLLATVDKLDVLVQHDIPFHARERQDRMTFLKDTVVDYDLGMGEKLRRVLEGLQAELGYAQDAELIEQQTITIEGKDQLVSILRAGRVGYYAISVDKTRGWFYQLGQGFTALNEEQLLALADLKAMMESKMFSYLPALPVCEVSREK
ncbi:MAG: hypothetical protein CSA26_02450 [Desulfobacterales bacterium]|nr:MAG: hypothetical protein CSA26_02450 [Desulfobacterales bacterium]